MRSKLLSLMQRNMDIIIGFILLNIILIPSYVSFCTLYRSANFDIQALMFWDYSSILGMFPYKDIFYPYGLLPYYRNQIIFFHTLYILIIPLSFSIILFTLKYIWKEKIFTYLSFASFFLFVKEITGYEAFRGYGISVIFLCITVYLFCFKKGYRTKYISILGLIIGIIFSLIHNQGFYLIFITLTNIIFFPFCQNDISLILKKKYYVSIIPRVISFILAVFVGVIPFLMLLIYKNSLDDFYLFFSRLSHLTLYGKSPFIPYSLTPENIFTYLILLVSISSLAIKFFITQEKFHFRNHLQMGLIIILILYEQISIIRSIDSLITFVSFFLLITLFADLKKEFDSRSIPGKYLAAYFILVVIFVFYKSGLKHHSDVPANNRITSKTVCTEENISYQSRNTHGYFSVKKILEKQKNFNGKIFSFPGDPIFYILLKQLPPYYSNNYDSSSIYAQEKQIQFIKNQSINYVIYNLNIQSIQDGVPNYVRTPVEMKYIFKNYGVFTTIDNFLILKKDILNDIFSHKADQNIDKLKKYLLEIDIENIPRSEGIYKSKTIQNESKSKLFLNERQINEFLTKNRIDSNNKIVLLYPNIQFGNRENIVISITTEDNISTNISFNLCYKDSPCILNLSNIPLFYKDRIIKHISFQNYVGSVRVISNSRVYNLW